MQVRVLLPAPNLHNPNLFPVGDGFGLLVFFDRYEDTHFRNRIKKQPTSKPRELWKNQTVKTQKSCATFLSEHGKRKVNRNS